MYKWLHLFLILSLKEAKVAHQQGFWIGFKKLAGRN